MSVTPYSSSPVFDETTLPAALQSEHTTKEGVWAVIRILEGSVRYTEIDPPSQSVLTPAQPGLIHPQRRHFVTPQGPVRLQVDFYRARPDV